MIPTKSNVESGKASVGPDPQIANLWESGGFLSLTSTRAKANFLNLSGVHPLVSDDGDWRGTNRVLDQFGTAGEQ